MNSTMEHNSKPVNQSVLMHYSRSFAQKLSDYFFIDHQVIEGEDILKFCDIKQVNLLVIKLLFEKWQEETQKLKNPYFDYGHPDVQKALNNFMNTLSQHISIRKDDFYVLVYEATRDALMLALDPYQYFITEFKKPINARISVKRLKEVARYVQFNKFLIQAFITRVEATGISELFPADAIATFGEVFEQQREHVEPMDWRLKSFSDLLPLDTEALFSEEQIPATPVSTESPVNFQPDTYEHSSDFGMGSPILTDTTMEAIIDERNTLNEKHRKENTPLVEEYKNAKVDNLRAAIPLNQKFLFINQLFKGNSMAFNEVIDRVELCHTFDEARMLINNEYAVQFDWNFDDDVVAKLFEVIKRRFE